MSRKITRGRDISKSRRFADLMENNEKSGMKIAGNRICISVWVPFDFKHKQETGAEAGTVEIES